MHDILEAVKNSAVFDHANKFFRFTMHLAHPKLCIITGINGSGKSLLRKVIHANYSNRNIFLMHLSQEGRCRSEIFRSMIYGNEEDDSTGYNSVRIFRKSLEQTRTKTETSGLLIDEPEIGCGEEVQLAMGMHLASSMEGLISNVHVHGVYVVTHSRLFVQPLMHLNPSWIRLGDDMTLANWMNRSVQPASLEEVEERCRKGYHVVKEILDKLKKKGK